MARRSTGACSGCSRHSGQPRQAVWEGLQGQGGRNRARWRAEWYHDYELSIGSPAAGLRGALLDGRLLHTLSTVSESTTRPMHEGVVETCSHRYALLL